jgi:hypothetical protein
LPIENLKSQLIESQHYCTSTKSLDCENHEDANTSEMTNKKKRPRQEDDDTETHEILRYY